MDFIPLIRVARWHVLFHCTLYDEHIGIFGIANRHLVNIT